jgi:hypothetical protein
MPLNVDNEKEYNDVEQQEQPKIYNKYEQIHGLK